jgi:hypothetical protein
MASDNRSMIDLIFTVTQILEKYGNLAKTYIGLY